MGPNLGKDEGGTWSTAAKEPALIGDPEVVPLESNKKGIEREFEREREEEEGEEKEFLKRCWYKYNRLDFTVSL